MLRDSGESDLSELEQEFELEMEDLELDEEAETDEEFEDSGDYEEDLQGELEAADEEGADYADRFYELSQMEYESEADADQEMEGLLEEMEQEYFFGEKFLKNKAKGLIKKGIKFAAGKIPALQALKNMTHLSRLNLRNLLKTFGKPLLQKALAATPQGAAALTALKVLGYEATEDSEVDREVWDNYVGVCKEAYEHLAQNLNENADNPLVASELATKAFKTAVRRRQNGLATRRMPGRAGAVSTGRRKRVVYLDPGEYVVVRRR